ncbi:L,D-transpeptidase [Amycolatopsis sp. cg5]|uniref:L,D-transpeptidase n=1 Tax=Amycolatopsis sp. cg5 TaxID=3238802 RepID=UPI0035263544
MTNRMLLAGLCVAAAAGLAGCADVESALGQEAAAQVTVTPETPTPTPSPTPTSAPKPSTPCGMTDGACANLSERRAWLLQDGEIVYGPVPLLGGGDVGTGYNAGDTATPVGEFKVTNKVKDYWSKAFDAPMPNSVFFYPGIAFHSGSLTKKSHGCIHLSPEASGKFFAELKIGDAVEVVA